jgi:hypothetical protein
MSKNLNEKFKVIRKFGLFSGFLHHEEEEQPGVFPPPVPSREHGRDFMGWHQIHARYVLISLN